MPFLVGLAAEGHNLLYQICGTLSRNEHFRKVSMQQRTFFNIVE